MESVELLKLLLLALVILLATLGIARQYLALTIGPHGARGLGILVRFGRRLLGRMMAAVGHTVLQLLSVALNWPTRRARRPQLGGRHHQAR